MATQVREQGDVQIVRVGGDFTVGRHLTRPLNLRGQPVEDLRDTLAGLLDRGARKILLDLGVVTFIDSAGLGELVAWKKRAVERGGDIKLLQPAAKVRQLLVMTLLTQIFDIYDDEQEAIRSF